MEGVCDDPVKRQEGPGGAEMRDPEAGAQARAMRLHRKERRGGRSARTCGCWAS